MNYSKGIKKSFLFIILTIISMILLTACQKKGLVSYQNALETTSQIEKGEVEINIDVKLNFDKTDLSFEEEKELSNFEGLNINLKSKYDLVKKLIETNIYYIQGGFGIDTSLFVNESQLIAQLPIINLYMVFDKEDLMNLNLKKDSVNLSEPKIDLDQVIKNWIAVFKEEDVLDGKTVHILTSEGQLKTKKYTYKLDKEQVKVLENQLISKVDLEQLNTLIVKFINKFNKTEGEIGLNIKDIIDKVQFTSIEGEAFIGQEDRIVQENVIVKGIGIDVKSGELESFEIKISMTYSNLGEEQNFEFPILNDENVVNQEDLIKLFDIFSK